MLAREWMVGCGLIFSHDMKLLCFISSRFRYNRAAAVCIWLQCRCSAASDKEKGKKVEPCTTFPTYCLSVPVYSSNKKNWFHIQPRLERLSGTPLASCPVSPDPLRPPVVLLKALSPWPGELRWTMAHSTINMQTFLLSMAAPPQPSVFFPLLSGLCPGFFFVCLFSVRVSDQFSCCNLLKQERLLGLTLGGNQHLEHLQRQSRVSILGGEEVICYCTSSRFVS